MATLNIKNFPEKLYRKLRARARREHRSVAQQVTHMLAKALDESEPLSILELRGLGKELWTDAAKHVDVERRSWDHSEVSNRAQGRAAGVGDRHRDGEGQRQGQETDSDTAPDTDPDLSSSRGEHSPRTPTSSPRTLQ